VGAVASSLVAITWEPELRGLLVTIIGVAVLMGSIYIILATNLGARLGFLVALTGLFGWLALMGAIWAIYGIGLRGPEPSWEAVTGRTVLQDSAALEQAQVLAVPVEIPDQTSYADEADLVAAQLESEGWRVVDPASPSAGQAGASAGEFLEETGAFEAGDFQVTRVFDTGGDRYPMIGDFDLLALWHEPRYALVEVAPLEPTRTEPGRAAPTGQIDESQPHQYVYMVRDLGARRQPAFVLMIGATIIFLTLCWLLHQRDARVRTNVSQPAPTPVPTAGS
jgi:hypothetical protein